MAHVNLSEIRSLTEDWTGMAERSERKKLQNRLNQRALRKRRAVEEQNHSSQAPTLGTSKGPRVDRPYANASAWVDPTQPTSSDQHGLAYTRTPASASKAQCAMGLVGASEDLKNAIIEARESYRRKQPNPQHFLDVLRFNVFYAFAHNARALGFDNAWLKYEAVSPLCTTVISRAAQYSTALPPNLVPTDLQYDVEHHPWIDFLPCPIMRNNFLRRLRDSGEASVDEDRLCVDIVDGASARRPDDVCLVTWGLPWELSGWEVTEAFWEKWPWLLEGCNELLRSTNHWRGKRGLPPLQMTSCFPKELGGVE